MSQLQDFFSATPVWTPEIERVSALAAGWIANGLPGGYVWGIQRSGKSQFGQYLKAILPSMLSGGVVTAVWSFGLAPKTPNDVLQRALMGTGCHALTSRDPTVLQARLLARIEELCESARATRFVGIVDEIQKLKYELFPVLQSITDDLHLRGITPFFLSIGQPEIEDAVELLYNNVQLNLIGRFFNNKAIFHGLTPEHAVEMLDNLDGPNGEFTRRWFPSRAQDGWRVKDIGSSLEAALDLLVSDGNLTTRPHLPMGYLRPALNSVFRELSLEGDHKLDGPRMKLHLDEVNFTRVCAYYVPARSRA